MSISTKNFHPSTDPKLKCTCGSAFCDERSVKQGILDKVQSIRDDVGRPLTITSGGRCPYHFSELRRTRPADHQKCIAVDIEVGNGFERSEIIRMGLKYGANAIGAAHNFVHLGWRENVVDTLWVYK